MEITWLGHACFRLKGKQAVIITDPFPPESGYTIGKQNAHIVTVSHQHAGHSYVQAVDGDPKVITGPGEYEISGVIITGVQTYHDNERGAVKGKNTAYLIEMDDLRICHLGDLGHVLTSEQTERVDNVDILLVPVGGGSTIDAPHAAEVIRQVEARVVIPMHYQTETLQAEASPVDRFLKEMGVKEIMPQPKFNVTRANLPAGLQVVLLEYRFGAAS